MSDEMSDEIQISGLDPKPSAASGTDKLAIDDASNVTWYLTLLRILTEYVNPNAEIGESQVTGLIADLAAKLPISGGTLTGAVIAAADPVVPLGVATKQYVDNLSVSLNLQDVYDNTANPQHINFASGQGLVFNDNSGTNRFILTETFAACLNPFTVSKTGDEGISVLETSDPDSTVFEVYSSSGAPKGSKPFASTTTAEWNNIPKNSIVDYVGNYNTDTKTFDYYDLIQKQQILTIQHMREGSNITFDTTTYPGEIVISSSGGGTSIDSIQGSFNCFPNNNSAVTIPTTGPYLPVAIDATSCFNVVHTDGTSVVIVNMNGVDVPVIKNIDTGGPRWCHVIFNLTVIPTANSGQSYTFRIYTNTGGTNYRLTTTSYNTPLSISGLVLLDTNDYVYLTAITSLSLSSFVAQNFDGTLIDTTVASIPNPVTLNGVSIPGNLFEFDNTTGRGIDSGISVLTFPSSGTYIPSLTANAGVSGSITLNSAFFIRVLNIVIVSIDVSFTASDSSIEFTISLPVTTNFSSTTQATLMGQVLTTSSPNSADGDVINATSIASSSTIKLYVNSTIGSGAKNLKSSLIYEVIP